MLIFVPIELILVMPGLVISNIAKCPVVGLRYVTELHQVNCFIHFANLLLTQVHSVSASLPIY